jgi:hypothetical protein
VGSAYSETSGGGAAELDWYPELELDSSVYFSPATLTGRFIAMLTLSTVRTASASGILRVPDDADLAVLSLTSARMSGVIG